MAKKWKRIIGPLQLAASDALLYTCPATSRVKLTTMQINITSSSPTLVNLSIGADAAATRFIDSTFTGPLTSVGFLGTVLGPGETLRGHAGAATTIGLIINAEEEEL